MIKQFLGMLFLHLGGSSRHPFFRFWLGLVTLKLMIHWKQVLPVTFKIRGGTLIIAGLLPPRLIP